jgi:hypothetical protein
MTSRLSSLLVQDGLVSAKRMADAFQRQVIYGGTLDTNLLEMRVVEEDVLLTYLGRSSGLPTQPAGFAAMGAPAPEILRIFPRDLAERFRAIPCRALEEGVLRVLVADPVEPQDMEALAQNVRQRIEPWISTEFRVVEAMEAVYGEPMPPRFQRLLSRSKQAHEQKGLPPPRLIDPVPRFGNLHDFRLEATAPGSLAGMVLPIAESPAALAKAAELTSPPRLPRQVAFEDEATSVQPARPQLIEVQAADVVESVDAAAAAVEAAAVEAAAVEAAAVEAAAVEAAAVEAAAVEAAAVEAAAQMPAQVEAAAQEPKAVAPLAQESVPELIPEESAPVVPVKAPTAPGVEERAAAPAEAAPTQAEETPTQAPSAAPATKPAAQPPAGGGKRGKRNKRRGESHHAPATAPVIARPVITPPPAKGDAQKAPEQKAPEQKAPEQKAPEQKKAPPPAPAPTRAPAVAARGGEPTVVVTDLPSEVHETQRAEFAPRQAAPGSPASQASPTSAVPPHMTSEHTPLPAPFPSSDLSAPHHSLGATQPQAQGGESVPVPIDSGRLGEQIVIGRPSQPPREAPRVAVSLTEPRPTALSFEAARELIAAAQERDMIFEALCRAMRSRVAFAAVFTVHGDVAFGRTALLDGWLDRQALGKIAIPLDRPSAFRIAVKGRSPYAGRLGDQPAAGEALTAMGRKAPLIGAVLPVLVRGRPLALLYLDDDGRDLPAGLLDDLRPVMVEVSQAFQRLVLRSRAGFGGAQAEDGRRGQVQDEMIAPTTSAWRKPEARDKERDKRPTLSRFAAHGEVSAPPRVVEVRDATPPPAPPQAPVSPAKDEAPRPRAPEAAAPRESTESPTTKLRPEGPRRITAENRPVEREGRTPSGPMQQVERPRRTDSGKESRPEISAPRIETRPPAPSLADLVARAATGDEKAVEQLLAGGEQAARALVMALPGPLKSRERQALGDPIGEPVYLRSPLLALVPRMGQAAVQPLLERLDNPVTPPDIRYYVALCFSELPVTAAIAPLGRRLFDSDDAVRMAAVTALRSCPPVEAMRELLETLRSDLLGPDPRRQQHAVEALGELRDVQAVPRLIQILSSSDLLLVAASARALQTITKQDFGRSRWRWRRWWSRHQAEPRLQWMLSALSHESSTVRASAQDELRSLCGDVAGYRFDLPRRDRDAACRRWVRWWQGRGYSVYVP